MKRGLRFGLIGVGGIGGAHLAALSACEASLGATLVAVADPSLPALAGQKAVLEGRGVRWHLDFREMLDAGHDLDAVVVATPIPLHLEMTRQALARGLAVYLEKPPVPLIQQLEALRTDFPAARVAVGFQMITAPPMQAFKALLAAGELGEITEFRVSACWPRPHRYYERARWAGKMALGGEPVFDGPLTNALAHLVHNVMHLATGAAPGFDVPTSVQGELYRVRPSIESYDVACVRGQLASGPGFSVAFSHTTQEERRYRLEARGSRGWARLAGDGARLERSTDTGVGQSFDQGMGTAMESVYTDFIDFLEGRREHPATRLEDVRGFLRTTNGALVSSGGVHAVEAGRYRLYGEGEGAGYDVPGMTGLMDTMFEEGKLFSETPAPWAVPTAPVDVRTLTTIDFPRYCSPRTADHSS